MIAYVDASVVLRFVLGQRDSLAEWSTIQHALSSALAQVECLRTLDRLRLRGGISDQDLATARARVFELFRSVDVVDLTDVVLDRASQAFPTPLGTLDALHLATAVLWRESHDDELALATHDEALGMAAKACGFRVVGV